MYDIFVSSNDTKGEKSMIDANKLRGAITSAGYTQTSLAAQLGISGNTLSAKINKGVFLSTEISEIIRILNIKDPMPIFFAEFVS
jgi:DNA-binding XRE family transcriptional regulator